ncbi:uncharacterized protein TNCV_2439741 [Trichonephila clavipes]|nr:uncharacterized protein TNCV_2439741 [Trichonephila clavipes]
MKTTTYRSRSGVSVRHFFPSRHYSAVRSRLGARGTMTTTSYRRRLGMGVRHFFRRGTTLRSGRVLLHAERCQRHATAYARRWVFVTFFPSRPYSAVRSRLLTRGTTTTTSYRSRSAVGVRHLFPSWYYSAVRSFLGARGTMTTISYRTRSAVGVRHFFRRATTRQSGGVLMHAER